MNTPPPPPHHHFRPQSASSFGAYTPVSERSFDHFGSIDGSDRYSDVPIYRTRSVTPHIETRRPAVARAETFGGRPTSFVEPDVPVSVMESTDNKDYLYFVFTRDGAKWDEDPIVHEIRASQSQIKKKSETRHKTCSALQQMQKMGYNRRDQIDKLTSSLCANEIDGSLWEPIWIENTKIKERGCVKEIKTFEIIFARKQPKQRRNSIGITPILLSRSRTEELREAKANEAKKEKRKSKDKKAAKSHSKGGLTDDPFAETQWFDQEGGATGGPPGAHGSVSLPPYIPPEQPINTPRIIPGLNPEHDGIQIIGDHGEPFGQEVYGDGLGLGGSAAAAEDLLGKILQDANGGDYDRHQSHDRRPSRDRRNRGRGNASRSRSRSRPQYGRRRTSESATRNVRFSGHRDSGIFPISDNSSINSAEFGFQWDEVEELSSHTSDTSGSMNGRKSYRQMTPAYRQHRPGPLHSQSPKQYELTSNEKVLIPAKSRRRSSRVMNVGQQAQIEGIGFEQPLTRRNTEPRQKPAIHQISPPTDVPPIAVFPQYFEDRERRRERDIEEHITDYMHDEVQKRSLRDREDEIAQRERALYEEQRREDERRRREEVLLRDQMATLRLERELGRRRTVYTHEPRESFGMRY